MQIPTDPAPDAVRIRRALLSVSDKTGLLDLARALHGLGVELISTGGTAKELERAGLPVVHVEAVTGFPEMMDGRVKTLHPLIHGGILALRGNQAHVSAMDQHGIRPIDLVCVNLYPFERTVAKPGVERAEAVENIDVGGPGMIRAAAKNHAHVVVLSDSAQYRAFADELVATGGHTSLRTRAALAADAFLRCAAYDAAIAGYLHGPGRLHDTGTDAGAGGSEAHASQFAPVMVVGATKVQALRYGENPHQHAAVYRDPTWTGPSVIGATQIHGKELSYNNINDAAAALSLAIDLAAGNAAHVSAAIIKHANPCGAATAPSAREAVDLALRGDPLAAYGGILALAGTLDEQGAELLCQPGRFLEVVVAGAFEPRALELLRAKSANVRLLEVPGALMKAGGANGQGTAGAHEPRMLKWVPGGFLCQSVDGLRAAPERWEHRAGPVASAERLREAAAVWTVVKHLSSNAVAIGGREPDGGPEAGSGGAPPARGVRLFGAGAGQMDRVTSCRLAIEKAGSLARGAIAASDAFFPFADGPTLLADAGVSLIVHTGGSKRDQETFDLCAQRGISCYTTGVRHFRH